MPREQLVPLPVTPFAEKQHGTSKMPRVRRIKLLQNFQQALLPLPRLRHLLPQERRVWAAALVVGDITQAFHILQVPAVLQLPVAAAQQAFHRAFTHLLLNRQA